MRNLIRTTGLVIVVGSLSACSMQAGEGFLLEPDQGRVLINTDRAGMESLSDLLSGLITNGKASPDTTDTPSWQLRREQTQVRALRYIGPVKKQTQGGK